MAGDPIMLPLLILMTPPSVTKNDADPHRGFRKKHLRVIILSLIILNVSLLGMNTCDLVTEENSPLSLSLIRTLLTIGGVELNPGPPMMTEKGLKAELVLGAEEQSSKDNLIKVESVHDQKTTRNVLNTANTEQLRTLAKYILAWDKETSKTAKNYKKEGLITLIYNRPC